MNAPTASASDRFDSLPGVNTEVFRRIWQGNKFLYQKSRIADFADERSARLITASVIQKRPLFLVFPDERPHRPAFLLSTALIALWWHSRKGQHDNSQPVVLYFGSKVGIREQLHDTSITGLSEDLASVFEQTKVGRQIPDLNSQANQPRKSSLPQVITVYSPADPCGIVQSYRPDLIAVDLSDSSHAEWFDLLLTCASQARLPLIAWGTNPLSTCIEQFQKTKEYGDVFIWPASEFFEPSTYPTLPKIHTVQGITLTGKVIDEIEAPFRRVYGLLLRASKAAHGPLENRAIAAHWNYLRALESMSVPCELYDAEAPHFWGLKPLHQIREACQKFRDVVSLSLATELESAANLLDNVSEIVAEEPPVWSALIDLCMDSSSAKRRTLTFTGRSRKQMFLFALLARYNITEDDLRQIGIEVSSLDQFPRLMNGSSLNHEAILATLPSPLLIPKLLPFLTAHAGKVVVFPHQLAALEKRISSAHRKLFSNSAELCTLFEHLGTPHVQSTNTLPTGSIPGPFGFSELIRIEAPATVTVGGFHRASTPSTARPRRTLIKENAAVEELTRLFEPEEAENSLDVQADIAAPEPELREGSEDAASDLVTEALVLRFREKYRISFPTDYMVQLITISNSRQEIDERYVSALRPGDRIVYIQGQKRQNLYDLIVSRVHKHPAFEIHVALIRRWQDDLRTAYLAKTPRMSADELLAQIQDLGSRITSPLAVHNWINGTTLCPDDSKDLERVGKVLNLTFLINQHRSIAKAATRLRGIHIGLARRLNNWLSRACVDSDSDAEVFDRDLGLTFGDFRHSLVVLTVDSVQRVSGPFLRSSLGKLEKI